MLIILMMKLLTCHTPHLTVESLAFFPVNFNYINATQSEEAFYHTLVFS